MLPRLVLNLVSYSAVESVAVLVACVARFPSPEI